MDRPGRAIKREADDRGSSESRAPRMSRVRLCRRGDRMTASGTSRYFAASQQFGRFRSEAGISGGLQEPIYVYAPLAGGLSVVVVHCENNECVSSNQVWMSEWSERYLWYCVTTAFASLSVASLHCTSRFSFPARLSTILRSSTSNLNSVG